MPLGILGKYERLDVLGHGASGIVYLAKDTLLNKQVALKEVDVQAGDLRRFLEEARVMDRLRHPNIVRVNGVDRIEGKIVIDMEYVRGQNLQELLRRAERLLPDRALDIAAQVLDALDYAHRMQTVHRDIKPANILVASDGAIKLVDFGLAEILSTNAYAGGAGTYAYMAPEDFAEEDRSDSQSDIWAVGVTLYEMLTGNRPFQVAKVKDPFAWKRVLEAESPTPLVEYLPNVSPALQSVLSRALARSKRDRYQTAGEFRDDLLRLRAGQLPMAATLALSPPILAEHARRSLPVEEPSISPSRTATALPRTGPGVVVAEVAPPLVKAEKEENPTSVQKRLRLRPNRREVVPMSLRVQPESVDFGAIRKGDQRSVKLQVTVTGIEGNVAGCVGRKPEWLKITPADFDRPRQTLTLSANSARAFETGDFQETLSLITKAGTTEIPIHLRVLKPRPTFGQIAFWFVPLFAFTLFPVIAVAFAGGGHALAVNGGLAPSAALATGMLSIMLLLIGIAADIGMAERAACGVLMAAMCFVLGVAVSTRGLNHSFPPGMQRVVLTGSIFGMVVLLQLIHLKRWKLWAFVLACLGLLMGGNFLHLLTV